MYHGNRSYNEKEWESIKLVLDQVSLERKLNKKNENTRKKKNEKRFPYPRPILTIHEKVKGPWSSEDEARQKAPKPKYFADIYNRENKGGAYPSCKAINCLKKFEIGSLGIRSDLCKIYPKEGGYKNSVYRYWFCVKEECLINFPEERQSATN